MQVLSGSVGEAGTNQVHDIALVQAILLKTTRAAAPNRAAAPYLGSYDGAYGSGTRDAIRAFQLDHVVTAVANNQSVFSANSSNGRINVGDATWAQLIARVDRAFSDMRVLAGGRTVYVAATAAQAQMRGATASGLTFTVEFRARVTTCISQMHALHGIAVGVCTDGARRDFATQHTIYNRQVNGRYVSGAGPGETNHNYGMASDIGFAGLRWLRANGDVVENETWWLHQLDPTQIGTSAEANRFWDALRTVGESAVVGAFRGPQDDRPHLQNWSDTGVSMTARLAAHLQSSGTMQWTRNARARGARSVTYNCDLGLGGTLFNVGTADQIWSGQATVTAAHITEARNEAAARAARQRPNPNNPAGAPRPGAGNPRVQPVAQDDVRAMQEELRAQMELADTNWRAWTPR
jgi:hypothetical protein